MKILLILSAGVLLLVVTIAVLVFVYLYFYMAKMFKQILDDTVKGMEKDKKMFEEMSKWKH
ncbi:hypothetical protein NSA16_08800 [Ligilactobacillus murinus]|nr:hypothetical protein [Ligilactobacillus murinus]